MKLVADLFNLFNEQTVVRVNQYGEVGEAPGRQIRTSISLFSLGVPMSLPGSLPRSVQRPFGGSPRVLIQLLIRIGEAFGPPLFHLYENSEQQPCIVLRSPVGPALLSSPFRRHKKPQLPAQYKKWLDQDVVYIITDEERKAFLALPTDEAREKFEETFWNIRNPLHSSDRNPFKEEHYARIEYANSHFGRESNTPGWMTDMGRAYILFGPPTSRHPFVGYSQIYPMELWFYQNSTNSPSLPAFFYLLFYIEGDIGEYKFYRPFLDGPHETGARIAI